MVLPEPVFHHHSPDLTTGAIPAHSLSMRGWELTRPLEGDRVFFGLGLKSLTLK